MDLLAGYATSTYESVTGFNPVAMTAWATSSLIKLYTGTVWSILYGDINWIIAGFVIVSVVAFAFTGLRFFRL